MTSQNTLMAFISGFIQYFQYDFVCKCCDKNDNTIKCSATSCLEQLLHWCTDNCKRYKAAGGSSLFSCSQVKMANEHILEGEEVDLAAEIVLWMFKYFFFSSLCFTLEGNSTTFTH